MLKRYSGASDSADRAAMSAANNASSNIEVARKWTDLATNMREVGK